MCPAAAYGLQQHFRTFSGGHLGKDAHMLMKSMGPVIVRSDRADSFSQGKGSYDMMVCNLVRLLRCARRLRQLAPVEVRGVGPKAERGSCPAGQEQGSSGPVPPWHEVRLTMLCARRLWPTRRASCAWDNRISPAILEACFVGVVQPVPEGELLRVERLARACLDAVSRRRSQRMYLHSCRPR